MKTIINYLLSRADSLTAWVGAIGFCLEFILHPTSISTIMLVLFGALVVFPEGHFREIFKTLATKIRNSTKG